MTRRKAADATEHGRLAVVTVGERHRLGIPVELLAQVPWWSGGATSRRVVPGPGRSLVLVSALPDQVQQAAERLADREVGLVRAGSPVAALERYLATTWIVTIAADGRLTLPEHARKIGLAPSEGDRVVLFVNDSTIEIWRADRWLDQIEAAASHLQDLVEKVLDS